ncbi:hypothetical protein [Mycolicibacterium bacteremicum]|uniref:ribosome modulation factor n=1 Tax=Mycolicibacterium bacteremicum TaxID=564198 RepID=UPI0026ED9DAC|nr:hypothetical protein [Mycolicibacterium bacteremicum]
MTFKAEAIGAMRAGHNADIGDPNPYPAGSLLARIWAQGYSTMAIVRVASTPAMQKYLADRAGQRSWQDRDATC